MTIRPATCLQNEYNEIAAFCKERGEPVFLTENGEGDMVVMSIEAYNRQKEMLELKRVLLEAEAQRLSGAKMYTFEETMDFLDGLLDEE